MRRRVLCGCWARLAFPRAREKKAVVVTLANRRGLRIELLPACPRSRTARRPEWIPRRASMVSGGAAPGERALHACDPSEACKREPCPRPLMLPASIAIVCRLIGRALAAGAVPDGHEHGSAVAKGCPVRFGTGSNYVSNPRKTARDRAAYIARHRVNENHNDPLTPGALSRWLLWGESRSLARNTAAFRRRFRLQ